MYDEDMYGNLTNRNPMATAAFMTGLVSLFFCNNIGLALPVGALAILFAILSRTESKMPMKSKIGLACGLTALIATTCITAIYCIRILNDPEAMNAVMQYIQMYLGYSDADMNALFSPYQKGL